MYYLSDVSIHASWFFHSYLVTRNVPSKTSGFILTKRLLWLKNTLKRFQMWCVIWPKITTRILYSRMICFLLAREYYVLVSILLNHFISSLTMVTSEFGRYVRVNFTRKRGNAQYFWYKDEVEQVLFDNI